MYQFFVEPEQIDVAAKSVIIRGTDVNHIKNVLRMRPGEEVAVSNGIDGKEYRCGILALEEDCVRLELRFIKEDGVERRSICSRDCPRRTRWSSSSRRLWNWEPFRSFRWL